jgi:hypothetical protein
MSGSGRRRTCLRPHAARFPLCGLTKLHRTGGRDESDGWTAERVADTTHLLDGQRHADRLR